MAGPFCMFRPSGWACKKILRDCSKIYSAAPLYYGREKEGNCVCSRRKHQMMGLAPRLPKHFCANCTYTFYGFIQNVKSSGKSIKYRRGRRRKIPCFNKIGWISRIKKYRKPLDIMEYPTIMKREGSGIRRKLLKITCWLTNCRISFIIMKQSCNYLYWIKW